VKYIFTREPASTIAVVQATLALLIAFGVDLTVPQRAAIIGLVTALLELFKRARVTPVADPRLPDPPPPLP